MAAIADYAIIGDGRSAALVARDGSIDWMCWPRFESSPIFGSLLDDERGGTWRITPRDLTATSRRYREHTNVLETTHETRCGRMVVTDLMSIASEEDKRLMLVPDHELVRHVECVSGEVELDVEFAPRPDFGNARIRIRDLGALGLRWEIGTALLTLRSDAPLVLDDRGVARATIRLHAGEHVAFALAYDEESPAVLPLVGHAAREAIDRTSHWWKAWAERAQYHGPYRETVLRSALALKLMSYAPSGAIIAAPTTSLPEREGGSLNWDYRYCWLRDASFTTRVLLDLGYTDDVDAFCSWLLHATRLTSPELRVLYDVYGKRPQTERELEVAGYHGSRPVRVGNFVFDQLQLDTYGEVIDAAAQHARLGGTLDRETQEVLRDLGRYVCDHWSRPDAGIWEPREEPRHRTHSRMCCWVALDRLVDLHERGIMRSGDRDSFAAGRDAIRRDIELHAYDAAHDCYASELGGTEIDASLLQMSLFGFHPANAPRMRGTYARIREQLHVAPGLFHRNPESRDRNEGAFWLCSFWAALHLVAAGQRDEARRMFEHACSYANDLGLMAEEVDPRTGAQLGNFPQAYTHVGVIATALALGDR